MIRSPGLRAVHELMPNELMPRLWRTGRKGARPSSISSISVRWATAYLAIDRSLARLSFEGGPDMPRAPPKRGPRVGELSRGDALLRAHPDRGLVAGPAAGIEAERARAAGSAVAVLTAGGRVLVGVVRQRIGAHRGRRIEGHVERVVATAPRARVARRALADRVVTVVGGVVCDRDDRGVGEVDAPEVNRARYQLAV